jgi:hypothetical protein
MAWSEQKNTIFFQRARDWAAAVANLDEERIRLANLYNNEARPGGVDDPAFVDTSIATKQELIDLATNVMTPLNAFVNGGAVANVNRVPYLTPFLADQQ